MTPFEKLQRVVADELSDRAKITRSKAGTHTVLVYDDEELALTHTDNDCTVAIFAHGPCDAHPTEELEKVVQSETGVGCDRSIVEVEIKKEEQRGDWVESSHIIETVRLFVTWNHESEIDAVSVVNAISRLNDAYAAIESRLWKGEKQTSA
jgi:hypothetical protein